MSTSPPNAEVIQHLTTAAATADTTKKFRPTDAHRKIAGALMTQDITSMADLAEGAGYKDIRDLYKVLGRPEAVNWILTESASAIRVGLAKCYNVMLQKACEGRSVAWVELFLKRFDKEYRQAQPDSVTVNTQNNVFANYTAGELEAFVRDKQRRVLGMGDPDVRS